MLNSGTAHLEIVIANDQLHLGMYKKTSEGSKLRLVAMRRRQARRQQTPATKGSIF